MSSKIIGASLVAVIAGHILPLWLKFRGGKGIANSLGAFAALDYSIVLLCFGILALIYLLSRHFLLSWNRIMADASSLTFKVATEEWEFEQIHEFNYQTFVDEIPQHQGNEQGRLVDKFHQQNAVEVADAALAVFEGE